MENVNIVVTVNFGLEAVAKRELLNLGYENLKVYDGRVELEGTLRDIAILNLRLRSAERILIKIASFEAYSFEELFDRTYEVDWTKIISEKGNFIVQGRSAKSKLFSVSDSQRIVEKAIIKKLQTKYDIETFSKSEERYKLEVSLFKDIATITLDTSGDGLHKRGYREVSYKAPISETIAASMVLLSFWNEDRILCDPFCGSGTIPIEAAMIGKNIAPGIMRHFDSEKFMFIDEEIFKEERARCYGEIDYEKELQIIASDISYQAINVAKQNAEILGLDEDIKFFVKDIRELDLPDDYGVIITNPPYGVRIGGDETEELERELGKLYRSIPTWSLYAISSDDKFERNFGKKADRNRKLYNGRIKTYYYQFLGPRPK
ncbi:THUMP domain-containing class I SAM-dependent RNA methyltransferase [Anaerosphaera multitolerans]|uniref:Class I SAM-dependent RNA methyltransferase n=1 Tax=Anaerosphaera multitolerans TaxID=2487351 RepID=A0A437S6J0_9FIRM|nr:class I SAM-dependent RNA methyltransferase [Anaerosphaera multitolerans]RVU54611.1 class I SAM-dependent RNA methyltransferase [Anaerosphaera multitolerans]